MTRIGRGVSACCKVSGLVSEAGEGASVDRLRPYAEHLLEQFGPERLLWGSDWPVVTLASDYLTWWEMTERLLEPLDAGAREAVLGVTASRCYRLDGREA